MLGELGMQGERDAAVREALCVGERAALGGREAREAVESVGEQPRLDSTLAQRRAHAPGIDALR